jgi:uncharacterized protein
LDTSKGDRNWALLAHLSGCLWVLGVPFGGIIATTIIYLTKRHAAPFVAEQSREAQNFQITVSLAVVPVAVFAAFVVERLALQRATEPALLTIALAALSTAALMVANVGFSIVAAFAVQRGEAYRYPFCVRFLRAASEPGTAR